MVERFPLKEAVGGPNPPGLTHNFIRPMSKKYGKTIEQLISEGDPVAINAFNHGVGTIDHTLGEATHEDVDYGGADPRLEAARKHWGDQTAKGGSGPHQKI